MRRDDAGEASGGCIVGGRWRRQQRRGRVYRPGVRIRHGAPALDAQAYRLGALARRRGRDQLPRFFDINDLGGVRSANCPRWPKTYIANWGAT